MEDEESFDRLEMQLNKLFSEINVLTKNLPKVDYTRDMIKFMAFMTCYRFYSMNITCVTNNIDSEGKLITYKSPRFVSIEFENLVDDNID